MEAGVKAGRGLESPLLESTRGDQGSHKVMMMEKKMKYRRVQVKPKGSMAGGTWKEREESQTNTSRQVSVASSVKKRE